MTLPKQDPRKREPRPLHWSFAHTDPKTPWNGYLWGEAYWCECHGGGRSKPCVKTMTGGELTCDHCERGVTPVLQGYVPIVRESDGKPVNVIVHESALDIIERVKFRQRVLVSRGKAQCDGVVVCAALDQRQWHTTLAALRDPADLTESLLRIWKMPELTDWYRRTHGAGREVPGKGTAIGPCKPFVSPDGSELTMNHETVNRAFARQMREGEAARAALPGTIGESLPHLNGKAKRK